MIRTFLVDDERGARERLRHLLSSFGDVEIVGEAENGQEALQRIPDSGPTSSFWTSRCRATRGWRLRGRLNLRVPESFFVLPSIIMRFPPSSCMRLITC